MYFPSHYVQNYAVQIMGKAYNHVLQSVIASTFLERLRVCFYQVASHVLRSERMEIVNTVWKIWLARVAV